METALSTLAQVFVGPLVGTISDHYGPAILEKIGIKWNVTKEMEKLSVILLTIQDVLEDAEDKQTTSKLIRHWLRKLKDIAYDVEDLLDECATEEALHDPESTGIIDKATMIERIKRLINEFEEIAEQRSKFNLINLTSTTRVVHDRVDTGRETSSYPQDKDDSILPALRLRYNHLPQHLRQCFAYCSIFPKDYELEKEVLIQLWMANGFLQPKGNMELEDIGNGVFNDLVWRDFFQEVTFDNHRVRCKMHDLVHDLACSITRDECFSVVTDADIELVIGRRNTTRHLAIYHRKLFSPNFSSSMFQSFLRTLLQLDVYKYKTCVPPPLNFSNLIYLRVLDLSGSKRLATLPESIAMLKLLRYLDLSGTRIALLSDEVFGNLLNLQTLKLRECRKLEMLPGNMRKLTNLRHLDISYSTEKLVRMPVGMGQLKCLHMLSDLKVSEDSGCGVGELKELDHLGGNLAITCLWKVKDVRDAENAKLSRKENIRGLKLDWSRSTGTAESQANSMNEKLTADALQPHPNIEALEFYDYGGSDFPRWMNSTYLFSLEILSLVDCPKCKHLPTLGLLPHLKNLYLSGMPLVEYIGNEFYCDEEEEGNNMMKARSKVLFPALEQLQLYEMRNLKEWREWLSSSPLPSSSRMKEGKAQLALFPVLKYLTIDGCDGLKSLNNCLQLLTNLHELTIRDCAGLRNLPEWITNQRSLQTLELYYCKNLKSLPEGLQHLTALQRLDIIGCHPELHRRCQENTGEDWHKIAHIPLTNFIVSSDSWLDHFPVKITTPRCNLM